MKKKLKRIEWLNVYSKGFIVESINNNYNNEDFIINRKNKTSRHKLGKKNNSSSNQKENKMNKNISFEKVRTSLSNKNKNIISFDKKNYIFVDLNELFLDSNIETNRKENADKKEIKNKENNKTKNNNSTININFINIEQNIIMKKPEKKKPMKNRKKELKNEISSPLINYLNTQRKKKNIMFGKPFLENNKYSSNTCTNKDNYNKKEKENNKEIKIQRVNLNLVPYINNTKIKLRQNEIRDKYDFSGTSREKLGGIGDYTFDSESLMMTEEKNSDDFSQICNTTLNNTNVKNKNKNRLDIFFSGITKYKDFKQEKVEEIKQIMNKLKK